MAQIQQPETRIRFRFACAAAPVHSQRKFVVGSKEKGFVYCLRP